MGHPRGDGSVGGSLGGGRGGSCEILPTRAQGDGPGAAQPAAATHTQCPATYWETSQVEVGGRPAREGAF